MANDAFAGTVIMTEGSYFWFKRDDGSKRGPEPIALLSTPRWEVIG